MVVVLMTPQLHFHCLFDPISETSAHFAHQLPRAEEGMTWYDSEFPKLVSELGPTPRVDQ